MFNPRDFCDLAMDLFSKLPYTEALGRTVVGRWYYAVFLQAREKVNQKRPGLLGGTRQEVHWRVREVLKTMGYPNISGKLSKLSEIRGKADYDMAITIGKKEAEEALLLSQDIARLVANV